MLTAYRSVLSHCMNDDDDDDDDDDYTFFKILYEYRSIIR